MIGPGSRIRLARGQERLIRPSRREGGLVVVFASFYLDKQCLFSPLPLCAAIRPSTDLKHRLKRRRRRRFILGAGAHQSSLEEGEEGSVIGTLSRNGGLSVEKWVQSQIFARNPGLERVGLCRRRSAILHTMSRKDGKDMSASEGSQWAMDCQAPNETHETQLQ